MKLPFLFSQALNMKKMKTVIFLLIQEELLQRAGLRLIYTSTLLTCCQCIKCPCALILITKMMKVTQNSSVNIATLSERNQFLIIVILS